MAQHVLQYKKNITDQWHTDSGYTNRQAALEAGMDLFRAGYQRVYVDGAPLANPVTVMGHDPADTEPPVLSGERLELAIAKRLFTDDLAKIGAFADAEAVWRLLDAGDQQNYLDRALRLIDLVEGN